MTPLPDDAHAAYHLASAAHALEYTRWRSDPTTGPLACYVIDVATSIADEAADAIPWWHDVHHRVLTSGCTVIVGWSPLDAVADALARWNGPAADQLRTGGGSDTSIWSIAYFGRTQLATRVTLDQLLDADWDDLYQPVARIEANEREAARKHQAERSPVIQIWYCGNNTCDHDDDGVEIADFDHGDANPSEAKGTCSKCGSSPSSGW